MRDEAIQTFEPEAREASLLVITRGDVADDAESYAHRRIGAVIEHIDEPVLFARVKLTEAPDPARDRPAIAQVTVDINGEIVRAQVAGPRDERGGRSPRCKAPRQARTP